MRLPAADQSEQGMHLTPLIDVVFLLLIFFLVATRFDEQEKLISIRLAEILQAQPVVAGPNEVIINVTRQGEYVVADRTMSEPNLMAFLHTVAVNNPGRRTVQIRADREVEFRYPLTVIGICKDKKLEYYCTVLQKRT
jgi:biopolymer transport protein ExbD